MHLLIKYYFSLKKYLSLLSKKCRSALTTLKNNNDEPIYEEIGPPVDKPIYVEIRHPVDKPIYMNNPAPIYMNMVRAHQPIPVSKDDPRKILLNVPLQLMTTINSLSTEVPDEVNIGSKQSTKASDRIEVFIPIHIDVNNPHRFGLSCH